MGFTPINIAIVATATEAIAKFQQVNNELGKMETKALKAGGSVSEIDRAARIGTAGLMMLGAAAVSVAALSVKSAMDTEVSYARLGQAMANQGISSAANRQEVAKLVDGQAKLGFSAIDTANAYGTLLTATNSQSQSTKILMMAEDLARYKHISLEEASTILARGTQGSARAFKELGITLDTHIPKNEAIARAFDQLHTKIGGQATAYVHTFTGEVSALTAEAKNFADRIGTTLMPILITFIDKIKEGVGWLGQHKIVLVAVATIIGSVLAAAVVNLTKKLYEQAAAWAVANWELTLILLAIGAVGAGFVWLWNRSETFRQVIVDVMKIAVTAIGYLIQVIGDLATAFMKVATGPLKLFLEGLAFIHVPGAKAALNDLKGAIDVTGNFFDAAATKVKGFAGHLDSLSSKKLSFNMDFLKAPVIPDSPAGPGGAAGIVGGIVGGNTLKAHKVVADKVMAEVDKLNTKIAADTKKYQDALAKAQDAYDAKYITATSTRDTTIKDAQKVFNDFMLTENKRYADEKAKLAQDNTDKITAINKAGNDKLKAIIQQSIALLTGAFSSATKVDIGKLFTSSGGGVGDVLTQLTTNLAGAKKLATDAAALAGKGYSQTFVQEIVAQGSDLGDKMAQSILSASPEQQAQLRDLYAQMEQTSNHSVDALAASMSKAGSLATDALNQSYAQSQQDLADNLAAQKVLYDKAASNALTVYNTNIGTAEATRDTAISNANDAYAKTMRAANNVLVTAQNAAQKVIVDSLAVIQKEFDDKLGKVKTSVASTIAAISALKAAMASASTLATATPSVATANSSSNSTASPNLNGWNGTNAYNSQVPTVALHQAITVDGSTAPADIAAATVAAIKYGGMATVGSSRGN